MPRPFQATVAVLGSKAQMIVRCLVLWRHLRAVTPRQW